MEILYREEKPRMRVEIREAARRESIKSGVMSAKPVGGLEVEVGTAVQPQLEPEIDWPCWSSEPAVTLGDHVRSVFLDLCSGLTPGELQQTYPHHWGLLLSRLAHRPDLKLQLVDRVNRRD